MMEVEAINQSVFQPGSRLSELIKLGRDILICIGIATLLASALGIIWFGSLLIA